MLIVDGSAMIFRAYFSIASGLTTPDGTPINAVFGLVRILIKLMRDFPVDAAAVVFDAGRVTFRNEKFADYKANRPEPPDDMRPQFGLAIETVQSLKVPTYVLPGFEADDIIATLAGAAQKEGYKVSILTGDRDMFQLMCPSCEVIFPGKEGTFVFYNEATFAEKYGIPIDRFVDLKALMGDTSDNIPGVPGVGEKTALKLIANFGKLEQLYANIDSVKPDRIRMLLKEHKDNVFMFRELVTVHSGVPVEYDFAGRTLPNFADDDFQAKLESFGFNRIREETKLIGDLMAKKTG